MKKPRTYVTDHAIVRYFERVLGFDVPALKEEIARTADAAVKTGATGVVLGRWRYVVKFDEYGFPSVVTIEPATDPLNRRRSGLRTGGLAGAEPETCAVPGCGNAVSDRNPTGVCQVHGGRLNQALKGPRRSE